mgnify:CR=1 FL=1
MKGHSLDSIDDDIDNQIEEEMKNDAIYEEERERRAGLFDTHPELLGLIKDYLHQTLKVRNIEEKIAKLKEIEKWVYQL